MSSLEEQLAAARAEVAEERRGRQQAASTIADLKGQLVAANQTHVRSPLDQGLPSADVPLMCRSHCFAWLLT